MMRQSSSVLLAIIFGFSFGMLAALMVFNSFVSIHLNSSQVDPQFYTVEALTDEMEVEWMASEKEDKR